MLRDIRRFLNDAGQVITWPKKHADKSIVLLYLIDKFDYDIVINENEVNEILKEWHTFQDWPLLRRSLIDAGMLKRDINGYKYQRTRPISN